MAPPIAMVSTPNNQLATRRPRKLPKDAVEKLRKWLKEHLEHPYPTEEEKQTFNDTGLTKTQLNDWFINARRREVRRLLQEKKAAPTQKVNSNEGLPPRDEATGDLEPVPKKSRLLELAEVATKYLKEFEEETKNLNKDCS